MIGALLLRRRRGAGGCGGDEPGRRPAATDGVAAREGLPRGAGAAARGGAGGGRGAARGAALRRLQLLDAPLQRVDPAQQLLIALRRDGGRQDQKRDAGQEQSPHRPSPPMAAACHAPAARAPDSAPGPGRGYAAAAKVSRRTSAASSSCR